MASLPGVVLLHRDRRSKCITDQGLVVEILASSQAVKSLWIFVALTQLPRAVSKPRPHAHRKLPFVN